MSTADTKSFTLPGCATLVRHAEGMLSGCIAAHEKDFLDLGSKLQDFIERFTSMSGSASELAELASGQEISDATRSLSSAMEQTASVFSMEDSSDSLKELERIMLVTHGLEDLQGEFKRIVRTLQMLSVSTRIESARLGGQGLGFSTLADDVEKLAGSITTASSKIVDRSRTLYSLAETARAAINTTRGVQERCSSDIFSALGKNVAELNAFVQSSREFSSGLGDRTKSLEADVGEIVSSLQFHDIVRQQVEHVEHSLADILALLEGSGDAPRAGEGGNGQPDPTEVAGWISDVSSIQVAQLQSADQRLIEAVDGIRSHLRRVADNAKDIFSDIAGLLDGDAGKGGDALSRIERAILDVSASVKELAQRVKEIGGVMSSVASTVSEIATFVTDIEEVGSQIELIALNASVKAARTGEEGKALGVLAQAIQQLSNEARRQTDSVSGKLREISVAADALQANAERHLDTRQASEALDNQIAVVASLRKVNTGVQALFSRIGAEGDALSGEIRDASAGIDFHKAVSLTLGQARKEVERVRDLAGEAAPRESDAERPQRLKELLSRYTMEAERLIHVQAFGEAAALPLEPEAEQPAETDGGSEFGDNVELF